MSMSSLLSASSPGSVIDTAASLSPSSLNPVADHGFVELAVYVAALAVALATGVLASSGRWDAAADGHAFAVG